MKAQFVYENISFERGRDPKRAMDIGDKVAAYEKMMNPWLLQVEEKARKFGFSDNTEEVREIWKHHYPTDLFTDEDEESYDLVRSWTRRAGSLFGKKRTPTVKLEIRKLSPYWDNVEHHVDDAKKYGVYYIIISDTDHEIDSPGEGWERFDTDEKLQSWTRDSTWENLIKGNKNIHESINFERGKDPKGAMGIGLVGAVRAEANKLGLTKESSIDLVSQAEYGNKIGTSYQWDDETWANHIELDAYTNYFNFPTLRAYNSEEGDIEITGMEEIMEYVTSGELSKFINLE